MTGRNARVQAVQEVLHGVDIGGLRQAYELFGQQPDAGKLSLEARVSWQGQGMRATGVIGRFGLDGQSISRGSRHYVINYDAWQEFPGAADSGPEAIETVLSAMGACLIAMTSWHATRMGVELESLEAYVQTTFDGQEFLFPQGTVEATAKAFGDITYELRIKSPNASDEQIRTLERLAAACPVCALVGGTVNVHGRVRRAEAARTA
jgi:uncharacterized OsmC-like protein